TLLVGVSYTATVIRHLIFTHRFGYFNELSFLPSTAVGRVFKWTYSHGEFTKHLPQFRRLDRVLSPKTEYLVR
ncbi:unnamed protein product, partial [Callosobruchus maculatus]